MADLPTTALEKELPNGWKFALSNEYYRNLEGEYFENRGIPVEYEIDYPEDRQEFFKSVLDNIELDEVQILQAISELKKIIGEDLLSCHKVVEFVVGFILSYN